MLLGVRNTTSHLSWSKITPVGTWEKDKNLLDLMEKKRKKKIGF